MKTFKWVVEFEVAESWVEDGFDLTQDRAMEIIANALPFANDDEIKALVLKAPEAKLIRTTQGYTN
jgi:hypothetical protein